VITHKDIDGLQSTGDEKRTLVNQSNDLFTLTTVPSKKDKNSKFSLSIEPGVTGIDFSPENGSFSFSKPYQFNGENLKGIGNKFTAYDSKNNYLPPSAGPFTDQANRYILKLTHEPYGISLSAGIIHDKREQFQDSPNVFRYKSGGTEFTALLGKEFYLKNGNVNEGGFSTEIKSGGFLSYNDIVVDLTDTYGNTFIKGSEDREISGSGFVAVGTLSYDFPVTNWLNFSATTNLTYMKGTAKANVLKNEITPGNVSVDYSNISYGLMLNLKLKF
jgi:hypothetical protein